MERKKLKFMDIGGKELSRGEMKNIMAGSGGGGSGCSGSWGSCPQCDGSGTNCIICSNCYGCTDPAEYCESFNEEDPLDPEERCKKIKCA